jgi:drug/metabolite transporter (DMT)-like permease
MGYYMDSSTPLIKKSNALWLGWLLAFTTTLLFSVVPAMTKGLINSGLEPTTLIVTRYALSSSLLLLTLAFTQPKRLRIDFKGLMFCILCGFLYAGTTWTFTAALTRMSSSIASLILAVAPLFIFLLLMLRGERPTLRMFWRFALSFIGVYLLLGPGGKVDALGVTLVFLCCLFYAIYIVVMQWYLKDYDAQSVLLYIFISLTFFATLNWLAQGPTLPTLNSQGWIMMLLLVVGCTYLAQLGLFGALRILGSAEMGLMNPLEILLSLMWSAIFLSDRLSSLQWLGGSLILAAMLMAIERKRQSSLE